MRSPRYRCPRREVSVGFPSAVRMTILVSRARSLMMAFRALRIGLAMGVLPGPPLYVRGVHARHGRPKAEVHDRLVGVGSSAAGRWSSAKPSPVSIPVAPVFVVASAPSAPSPQSRGFELVGSSGKPGLIGVLV